MRSPTKRSTWEKLNRLRRQRRVQNAVTIGVVILGPILALATFLVLGPLDSGASDKSLRLILLADLVYILAVAALKLGAALALGVDNDPQALAASQDNAARNGIAPENLPVAFPEQVNHLAWGQQADVVIANILAGPLIELSDTLLNFLQPEGTLLLSGLLQNQAESLCAHYADRLPLRIVGDKDGWVCLRGNAAA